MGTTTTKLVSAAVSLAFVCGALTSGAALAVDKIRWAVPMAFGSNLTALGDTMPWVANLLDRMSNGAIKLSVQEPGKLIPALAGARVPHYISHESGMAGERKRAGDGEAHDARADDYRVDAFQRQVSNEDRLTASRRPRGCSRPETRAPLNVVSRRFILWPPAEGR